MSEQYIGEIRAFSFGFAPRGWALCNGQTLPISQNQALFSLLGTTYGGNGVQTFALPDLRGRLAMSFGQSSFGTPRVLGQVVGEETHVVSAAEMPAHTHSVAAAVNGTVSATNVPGSTVVLGSGSSSGAGTPAVPIYAGGTPDTPMASLEAGGGGLPHENRMPYMTASYCIALEGIFPARN